jgi:hypothetical protein
MNRGLLAFSRLRQANEQHFDRAALAIAGQYSTPQLMHFFDFRFDRFRNRYPHFAEHVF